MTVFPENHPISAVQEQEKDLRLPRLFNFDLPALKMTGRVLPERSNISSIKDILDIASGDGSWAIAAAQAAPHLHILGIEQDLRLVEEAKQHAQGIHNVHFLHQHPFRPLDFPDASFDLVNVRFIVGMIPAQTWSQVLQEYLRVIRPEGYLRLTENDMPVPGSRTLALLGGLIAEAFYKTGRSFSPNGRLLSITPVLKRLLQDAGCQDIRRMVYITNFSSDMSVHNEVCQDLATTYLRIQPFLIAHRVASQSELDQLYEQMLIEMHTEQFCALAFYLTAWGSKS